MNPLSKYLTGAPLYTLPNGGGTYNASGTTPAPVVTPAPTAPAPRPVTPPTPVQTPVQQPATDPNKKYINPATGQYFNTAEEYANYVMSKIPASKGTGDVTQYAGDALSNPDQSAISLTGTARSLNNARNDIATGTTDPYKVGNQSGIAYSPAELDAVEKAYAGIYTPALNDVFKRIEEKQKKDAEELAQKIAEQKMLQEHKYKLEEMAVNFQYDKALKGLDTAPSGGAGSYVAGENPTVDSYVDRINRGEITEKDAMAQLTGVKNTSLRAAISNALQQTRKQNVKYTSAMNDVNNINKLLGNAELGDVTGALDQFYPAWATTGDEAKARSLLSNMESNLQLAKSGSLQGQGAVSDYERSLVSNAATGLLARNLSEADFKDALLEYRAGLMLMNNENVPAEMMKGGQSYKVVASREDIAEAIKDGWTIKYIE